MNRDAEYSTLKAITMRENFLPHLTADTTYASGNVRIETAQQRIQVKMEVLLLQENVIAHAAFDESSRAICTPFAPVYIPD